MQNEHLPPACQYGFDDPPGKQLFAEYNAQGDPATAGIAWNGDPVPTFEACGEQVQSKWNGLATRLGFEGFQSESEAPDEKPGFELPTLHHGHAWLLKFLFKEFSADPFTFNLEQVKFEGRGKGIKIDREQENTKRWFAELVAHRAIVLHTTPDPGIPPVWCVRALANVTDDVVTLDPGMTLDKLLSEFVDIISEKKVREASCVVIKGDGIPPGFGDKFYHKLVGAGAKTDVLIVALPPGIDLSVLSPKQMKAKGWIPAPTKPRIWLPGDPLPDAPGA